MITLRYHGNHDLGGLTGFGKVPNTLDFSGHTVYPEGWTL